MKQIIAYILFTFSTIYGQVVPFSPISLEEHITDWAVTTIDTSVADGVMFDGRNHFYIFSKPQSLIHNGCLYSATVSRPTGGDVEGGLIEKIDLTNGEVKWRYIYDSRNIELRELPMAMYINDQGNLEVTNMRLTEDKPITFPSFMFGTDVTFSIHTIDSQNGTIIDHIYPSESNRNYSFNSTGDNDFLFYDINGNRNHLVRELRKDTQQYVLVKLDSNLNHTNNKQTIDLGLPVEIDDILFGGMYKTDSYVLSFDAKIVSTNNYKREYSLKFWDENWNVVYSLGDQLEELIEEPDPFKISIVDANDSLVLFSVYKQDYYYYAYFINTKGELIKKIDLDISTTDYSLINRYKIYEGGLLAIGTKSFDDPSLNKLEIRRIDANSELLVSTGFIPFNQRIIPNLIFTEMDDLVVHGWQFKDTLFNGINGNHLQGSTHIKLDKVKIGLISNIDPSIQTNEIAIYPNPTTNAIHFTNLDDDLFGYMVYDNLGMLVDDGILNSSTLSLAHLPTGQYIIRLKGNKGIFTKKIIKI